MRTSSSGSIRFFSVVACICVLAVAGFAQEPASNPERAPGRTPASATSNPIATEPRIAAGDLVEVSVYAIPELTQTSRVSGTGTMPLPLIGEVPVAGLTAAQAGDAVRDRLEKGGFVKHPSVTVFVKEYATQGVSVLGEVEKPGVYPVLGARRLYDLISAAQGLTQKAGKTVTITHRDDPAHPSTSTISADPAQSMGSNVEVFPGDTIVVSKAGVVYVVGDVGRPGGFIMDKNENLTVLQALALAEGAKNTAALSRAKVIRREGSTHVEIPVAVQKIMQAKAPDLTLQAEDILFVPSSLGKSAARRGMEAALQTAIGVAIYKP